MVSAERQILRKLAVRGLPGFAGCYSPAPRQGSSCGKPVMMTLLITFRAP